MIRRATVIYERMEAVKSGEPRHPNTVMRLWAFAQDFDVIEVTEQVLAQTWTFEIQGQQIPVFPAWCDTRPHR